MSLLKREAPDQHFQSSIKEAEEKDSFSVYVVLPFLKLIVDISCYISQMPSLINNSGTLQRKENWWGLFLKTMLTYQTYSFHSCWANMFPFKGRQVSVMWSAYTHRPLVAANRLLEKYSTLTNIDLTFVTNVTKVMCCFPIKFAHNCSEEEPSLKWPCFLKKKQSGGRFTCFQTFFYQAFCETR